MKRLLCALLAALLLFSLCGCQFVIDVVEVLLEEEPAETTAYSPTTPKATTPKATTPKATTPKATTPKATTPKATEPDKLDKNGYYYSKEDVALYIHTYGCLPDNFITKKEAQALGWTGGSLERYAPGKVIGGDRFGNYEGLLPSKKGRQWYEADCYYKKGKRNAHRILYSNDGLVYYTDDHYESFTQMFPSK